MLKSKLIVGLDLPDVAQAEKLVQLLDNQVDFFKIGHQLAFSGGLEFAQDLIKAGKKVFLDLKLLDIGNTVAHAVENIVNLGVDMLTIHGYPDAMRAAAKVAAGSNLTLLAVTVLTSMDDSDLAAAGYCEGVNSLVMRRALQAKEIGMGGIVASAQEAQKLRPLIGADLALVTPGIRLACCANDDQKRVMTPASALKAGASHLVVARPILMAADPLAVLEQIYRDMASVSDDEQ